MSYEAPCLLVASPALLDPNFLHSVVLIVEHDEEGALGLILNRPLPLALAQVCAEGDMAFLGSEEATAWRGGRSIPSAASSWCRGCPRKRTRWWTSPTS